MKSDSPAMFFFHSSIARKRIILTFLKQLHRSKGIPKDSEAVLRIIEKILNNVQEMSQLLILQQKRLEN